MANKSKKHQTHRVGANGFTLVEVIVAATILVIVVIAAISAMRKGVELEVNDNNRRQARVLIHEILERDYDYRREFNTIGAVNTTRTDTLDPRNGNPLLATIRTVVTVGSQVASGTTVPVKKVIITATWQEPGGAPDTVRIEKWLAKAQ